MIKVEHKKKFQQLDWNYEFGDTARQRKRKHIRPVSAFFLNYGARKLLQVHGGVNLFQ